VACGRTALQVRVGTEGDARKACLINICPCWPSRMTQPGALCRSVSGPRVASPLTTIADAPCRRYQLRTPAVGLRPKPRRPAWRSASPTALLLRRLWLRHSRISRYLLCS
jgi:hypothetical protein